MTTEHMLKTEIERVAPNGGGHGEELTVLSAGDGLEGSLTVRGDGRLLGSFSGEVDCEGELLVGPDAVVSANIRTRNIVISGIVRGNVAAAGRLRITSSGRLEGDARVGALVVQEGGVHHGAISVHPEGLPDEPGPAVRRQEQGAAPEPAARAQIQASVERVRKFWGELF